MAWLQYFDYSFYAALVCVLLGYVTFPALSTWYSFGRYTALLMSCVFGITIVGFALGFFGPFVFAGGRDTVMPAFGSVLIGPLSAVLGLLAFWIYAFRYGKDT